MTRRDIRTQRKQSYERKHEAEWPVTGAIPTMLQDQSTDLSYWLSERVDSRMHAREAAEEIRAKE